MSKSATVVPLPAKPLSGIGVAATAGTGNRITGSRSEIWSCAAFGPGSTPLSLYIKVGLPVRAMLAEALAAQIAFALGVESPTPYLVTVNPKHVGRPPGKTLLCFGSLDVSEQASARPIKSREHIEMLFDRLKVSEQVCVFDEWIANDVRHPSDILLSTDGRFQFIDHEASMGEGVDPGASLTNWLANRMLERTSDGDRPLLLRRLRSRLVAISRLSLGAAPAAVQFAQDGVPLYESLLTFLHARLEHLDRLISERIVPEQRYLQLSPPSEHISTDEPGRVTGL